MHVASKRAWTPRRVRFIRNRHAGRCYWCALLVPKESAAVHYADEHAIAHEKCHKEAVS